MKSWESVPLEGSPGHHYRVYDQVTYRETCSPNWVVVSLREGKLAILYHKEGCLVLVSAHVRVWLSSWSCAHVTTWCGAMLQYQSWQHYLALWWFASCPVWRELVVAFVIVSPSSGGISMGVGSGSHAIGCLAGHGAGDPNPEPQGHGPCWLDWP
jgi:hypothetical protein